MHFLFIVCLAVFGDLITHMLCIYTGQLMIDISVLTFALQSWLCLKSDVHCSTYLDVQDELDEFLSYKLCLRPMSLFHLLLGHSVFFRQQCKAERPGALDPYFLLFFKTFSCKSSQNSGFRSISTCWL